MTDSLTRIVERNLAMRAFLLELLNPEQFGLAVTAEVRDRARELLNLPRAETVTLAAPAVPQAVAWMSPSGERFISDALWQSERPGYQAQFPTPLYATPAPPVEPARQP